LNIRKATVSDLSGIIKVERDAYPPHRQAIISVFKKRLELFEEGFFVLEIGNVIAGFCIGLLTNDIVSLDELDIPDEQLHNPQGPVYELRSLTIMKKFQGQGFGQLLIKKQLAKVKELGKKHFRFTAARDVEKFYEKLGFKRITPYENFHNVEQAIWEK